MPIDINIEFSSMIPEACSFLTQENTVITNFKGILPIKKWLPWPSKMVLRKNDKTGVSSARKEKDISKQFMKP